MGEKERDDSAATAMGAEMEVVCQADRRDHRQGSSSPEMHRAALFSLVSVD